MLSRVAENLYWLGRYVERTENVARLLDVAYHLDLDSAVLKQSHVQATPLESVLAILACREPFEAAHGPSSTDRETVLQYLTFDRRDSNSIVSMLGRARENARASREALSGDAWDHLNALYLTVKGRRAADRLAQSPLRFLDWVKRGCILFSGLIESTLPRTEAYHFLQLGRHLERVNQIGRILQIKLPPLPTAVPTPDPLGTVHWSNLLRSCSAYEAYLREFQEQVEPAGVVGFLVLNDTFPRAILYCVQRCCESLQALGGEGESYNTEAGRLLGRLESELRFLDVREILDRDLPAFLVGLLGSCNRIGDGIHQAYFFSGV